METPNQLQTIFFEEYTIYIKFNNKRPIGVKVSTSPFQGGDSRSITAIGYQLTHFQ